MPQANLHPVGWAVLFSVRGSFADAELMCRQPPAALAILGSNQPEALIASMLNASHTHDYC